MNQGHSTDLETVIELYLIEILALEQMMPKTVDKVA